MKKIFAFSLVITGMLFFCACEKENYNPLIKDQVQTQHDDALKGADSDGMTQTEATPWPMAVRMGSGEEFTIPATEEYGVIIFYVNDPGVIPADHNFHPMGWFVPEAWGLPQEAFSIEGTAWWLPDYPMSPHHYHVKGKGDVLVWIITFEQVLQLYDSGVITIPKIAACNPLVGHAYAYNEFVRPYEGGAPVYGGVFNAKGVLEDGRKFIYNAKSKAIPGEPVEAHYMLQILDN